MQTNLKHNQIFKA